MKKHAFPAVFLSRVFILFMLTALLFSACTKTAPPPTVSPDHPLLFAMDFENQAAFNGWHVGGPGSDLLPLENTRGGKYVFEFPSGFVESEDAQYADIEISVDAAFKSDARMDVSVVCRLHQGEGYRFIIANDGQWRIVKWFQGSETVLADGWSAVIKSDQNRLAGRCMGRQLTLLVDGVEVGAAQDGSLAVGGIGLGYNAEKEASGSFDNLQVSDWPVQASAEAQIAKRTVAAPTATTEPTVTATPVPSATATPLPSPTPVPTVALTQRPTRIPTEDLLLYKTEFNESDKSLEQWQTFAYSMKTHAVQTEGFRIYNAASFLHFYTNASDANTNLRIYSIYNQDLGTPDVDVYLSTTLLPLGNVGLVCRYNPQGWYQFMYEPGGWAIVMAKYDESGQLHFHRLSSALYSWGPGEYNTDIRAECKGSRLTLYVDGEKKVSLLDDTFAQGQVGMLGWGYLNTGEIGLVDRFSVERAQWSESAVPGPAPTPGMDGSLYTVDFSRLSALAQHWYAFDPPDKDGTYARHLNDFDPGTGDIQITAGMVSGTFERGLICRYTEDGWYELRYQQQINANEMLNLFRLERDVDGSLREFHLGGAELPPRPQRTVSLTCAGSQLSAALDGESVIEVQDERWTYGRYGFGIETSPSSSIKIAFTSFTVLPAPAAPGALPPPAPLANQVVVSAYAPGESIYTWKIDDFVGRGDPLIPAIVTWFSGEAPTEQDGVVSVSSRRLPVVWGLKRDLYDLPVEVTAEIGFGAAKGGIGLFCRGSNLGRYEFLTQPDGNWYIRRNLSSWDNPNIAGIEILASGKSDVILPLDNQISAVCKGSDLVLYVNGKEIGRAQDDLLPEGQAGLFFDAYTVGNFSYLAIHRAE